MKVGNSLFILLMLVFATVMFGVATPSVAADSINVSADRPVYALGESVAVTVAYMGGVHGDVKLSMADSSGTVVKEWTWNHASSDPFQQSVSYAPANPGGYGIKALHLPHHMEPQASASTQVAVWSARILSLDYPNTVDAGTPVDIKATVQYYFTQATQVKLELWSNTEDKNLGTLAQTMSGQGTAVLTLTGVTFTSVQNQDITARIYYQTPTANWINDPTGGSYASKVTVVPEFTTTPMLMMLATLLSLAVISTKGSRRLAK